MHIGNITQAYSFREQNYKNHWTVTHAHGDLHRICRLTRKNRPGYIYTEGTVSIFGNHFAAYLRLIVRVIRYRPKGFHVASFNGNK